MGSQPRSRLWHRLITQFNSHRSHTGRAVPKWLLHSFPFSARKTCDRELHLKLFSCFAAATAKFQKQLMHEKISYKITAISESMRRRSQIFFFEISDLEREVPPFPKRHCAGYVICGQNSLGSCALALIGDHRP